MRGRPSDKSVDKHDYSIRAEVENVKLFGNGQFD